jgi:hypothetical protein
VWPQQQTLAKMHEKAQNLMRRIAAQNKTLYPMLLAL